VIASGRPSAEAPPAPNGHPEGRDALIVALPALALLGFFLALYPMRGFRFPVGADAPVYLWWSRLAGPEGLSAVGNRPGATALTLVLGGTLGLTQPAVLAGLGAALGTSAGLAAGALFDANARRPGRTAVFVVAAVLVGTFAVHLADGYFANLAFAALFLAAAALLARRTRAGTAAAGLVLGAAGLAHPLFWLVGAAILALTALMALLRGRGRGEPRDGRDITREEGRAEVRRIAAGLGGGALVAGAGLLALLPGPAPLAVDTSKDAFLRRAGLGSALRADYLDRFARHWARFALPLSVPVAAVGSWRAGGFLGRFLRAWGIVMVVGVAAGLATGLFPAVRFLSFGYVLPLGVAAALPALWMWLRRRGRVLAGLLVAAVLAAMVGGPAITWLRTRPYLNGIEVRRVAEAGRVAEAARPGTPLVFLVDNGEPTVSFLATRAGNVIRDALPADRVRDAYVYVGSPQNWLAGRPTLVGDQQHDELSRLYLRDIRAAGGHPLAFLLAPFNRPGLAGARAAGDVVARGVVVLGPHLAPVGAEIDPVRPTSSWLLVGAGLLSFLLLAAVGLGWALAVVPWRRAALALAPSLGAAALIVAGIALERVGVPLSGAGPPAISAVVGAAGYALAFRRARRDRRQGKPLPDAPAEVPQ
jgi:hypothetical protein